eukprot:CAMPEP_0204354732 /NCGR_PEP_ID=MMETSP0469-20131031/33619_1 /ASSEMBLY_ACC=CAM_ASM_000384 /TAXON_ID=2969 /ORGANISM="Oxyrrhis marina" /LENGTH=62 /DNA_ID=CAMNT_0051341869 /DNA_START=37 /DNA_END=222 /DNA_ORIENTATION=+
MGHGGSQPCLGSEPPSPVRGRGTPPALPAPDGPRARPKIPGARTPVLGGAQPDPWENSTYPA